MRRALAWLFTLLILAPVPLPSKAAAPPAADAFVVQTTGVLRFHVATSQLAVKKTKNEHVVNFARQLILDYSVYGMKFRQAVTESGLKHPKEVLDPPHKALFDELSHSPPGKPFAKAYVEMEAKALRDAAALFEAYAKDGDNERLKFFAQEMVPVLKAQIEQVEKLKR